MLSCFLHGCLWFVFGGSPSHPATTRIYYAQEKSEPEVATDVEAAPAARRFSLSCAPTAKRVPSTRPSLLPRHFPRGFSLRGLLFLARKRVCSWLPTPLPTEYTPLARVFAPLSPTLVSRLFHVFQGPPVPDGSAGSGRNAHSPKRSTTHRGESIRGRLWGSSASFARESVPAKIRLDPFATEDGHCPADGCRKTRLGLSGGPDVVQKNKEMRRK